MKVGDLPPQCAALNRSFLGPVELAVRAAVDGDPRLVRAAAMVDPNTAATLTVDQIWQLCARTDGGARHAPARAAARARHPVKLCVFVRILMIDLVHLSSLGTYCGHDGHGAGDPVAA